MKKNLQIANASDLQLVYCRLDCKKLLGTYAGFFWWCNCESSSLPVKLILFNTCSEQLPLWNLMHGRGLTRNTWTYMNNARLRAVMLGHHNRFCLATTTSSVWPPQIVLLSHHNQFCRVTTITSSSPPPQQFLLGHHNQFCWATTTSSVGPPQPVLFEYHNQFCLATTTSSVGPPQPVLFGHQNRFCRVAQPFLGLHYKFFGATTTTFLGKSQPVISGHHNHLLGNHSKFSWANRPAKDKAVRPN